MMDLHYNKGDQSIFLHVGLHKTGTTFLQQSVFPNLDGIKFINGFHNVAYSFFKNEHTKILISDEMLTGVPFVTSFFKKKTNIESINWYEGNKRVFENLSVIFPNAKIIIGFRKHESLLLSLYKQYLHEGGILELNQFFDIKENKGIIKWDDLFLRKRFELIELYFKNKPFIYFQEELISNPNKIINQLITYLGINEKLINVSKSKPNNKGVEYYQAKYLRKLNRVDLFLTKRFSFLSLNNYIFRKLRLTPRNIFQNKLSKTFKRKLSLPPDINSFVSEYYLEDWNWIKNKHIY